MIRYVLKNISFSCFIAITIILFLPLIDIASANPGYDFSFTFFDVQRTDTRTYNTGEEVKVYATVKNTGDQTVDSYRLEGTLTVTSPSGAVVYTSKGWNAWGTFSPGSIASLFTSSDQWWTIPSNAESGWYSIKLVVVFKDTGLTKVSEKNNAFKVVSTFTPNPSASIQSASVDKSSYNPGETVKVSVSIKNTGNVDLSGLKINVDIADPNGNNVIATTLQSGISLSAGQSYSTDYISYYTIPNNPISGTYKVAVGLWNSDSSKNYDIKYQITSFSLSSAAPTSTYLTLEVRPSSVNKGDSVEFWARLFTSSGSVILSKTLKFYVDGSYIGSESNPTTGWISKTYFADLNPGSYDVKVVFDGDSQYTSSYTTQTLTIALPQNQQPTAYIASISPNPATKGETIYFSGSGYDPDGSISGYNWRSSIDGQLSTSGAFSTSSLTQGTHTIYFKVKDNSETWSSETIRTLTINSKQNQLPTAYIDSISPNPATKGEYVYFNGSGYDPEGSIVGYNWQSNIDGQLSTSRSFSTSSLTQGTHTIYFKVKDDSGTWSSETTRTLTVSTSKTASASIHSASVENSSYNPGETVKVAVSIKNTGTFDISGLKINVDIADPNGNNVKATTLQSGISLPAGQSYSTGDISYYTVPNNPVSGTYKVTVGLWNSDSSKNYDIKYQITSFNVNGGSVGINQVYYIPSELYNLILNDDEKLKNSDFYVEGSWKTLKPDSETKNSISIAHQISNDRKTIYEYDKAIGAKKYEQVKVKIKVFDKNDEPVRGIDIYENIKLKDWRIIKKPLSCNIEAITEDDINKVRDYILSQLLFSALPGPDDKDISYLAIPFEVTLLLNDYFKRYGTCTNEWAYLKIGSTNNEGFIEIWVKPNKIPDNILPYKFAVRDDLSCVSINELMDKKIGETEFITIINPKEIEIKAVPRVGVVTERSGKEISKNIENFIQKNNLPVTQLDHFGNIGQRSTDYDIFIYLITPKDITERSFYEKYSDFNPTIDYYKNKGIIKFGDATYDSPSNGLISCYYSDHSLNYMIAGLGEEGFKTALDEFYKGKVNTVVEGPRSKEKQDSGKSIIDTISNFFKGIFGW